MQTMDALFQGYIELGYIPIGVDLHLDEDTPKMKSHFIDVWPPANLSTSGDIGGNAVALVTGEPSDLIVIASDVQKPKDLEANIQCGKLVFDSLVQELELPDNTPIQESVFGRRYFFSMSKSLENGLLSAKTTSKLSID
ncbi:hypothetical protein BGX26_000672, partial [Mortierella sp. AD094]